MRSDTALYKIIRMNAERPAAVFITGASSGLGTALARHYAQRGARLGLVARRQDALSALVEALPGTLIYAVDVRDSAAMAAAAADFLQNAGTPDLVIANAGISVGVEPGRASDTSVFREVMDTNVLGAVHTFQPFVDAMRSRGRGTLVGIASVAGFRGLPGSGAYSASKAALITYLESLRVELRPSGLQVTTICPGYIATPMTAHNPYRMPFLIDAETAASRIVRAIAAGRRLAVVPWQMAIVGRLLRCLPDAIYDWAAMRAPRKPGRE